MRFGLFFLVLQTLLWVTTVQAEIVEPKSASSSGISCTLHSSNGEGAEPTPDCDADLELAPPRSALVLIAGFRAVNGIEPNSAPSARNPDHLIRGPPARA